jgi:hypothetical protein
VLRPSRRYFSSVETITPRPLLALLSVFSGFYNISAFSNNVDFLLGFLVWSFGVSLPTRLELVFRGKFMKIDVTRDIFSSKRLYGFNSACYIIIYIAAVVSRGACFGEW